MTLAHTLVLLAAGTAAGVVGSAGGTASLISYPALLAVGLTPLAANVTNAVAFVATWPGSALGSRAELRGQGSWLRRQALLVVAGSAAGAALLLATPASAFARVVPYLLALAALALLLQPQVTTWLASRPAGQPGLLLPAGLIAVSAYDGYWGAGAGIMTLTVLMIAVAQPLVQANALKNMVLGIADVACCAVFVVCFPVDWPAVIPMAVGCLVGGAIGPSVTRRVPPDALRVLAALAGLALAVRLWVSG